jgi:hypothetical protein
MNHAMRHVTSDGARTRQGIGAGIAATERTGISDIFTADHGGKMTSIRRGGRLRRRYGYILAVVLAVGIISGTIAVIQNRGKVPDAELTSRVRSIESR